MSEEKKLKQEGETLAKVAVDSGMGANQLQTVYKLVKTKPLAFVQAFVKRQIGREVKGCAGWMKLLKLVERYEEKKGTLERVLMYSVMLYEYCEKEPIMALQSVGDPLIRSIVENHGLEYHGVTMELQENTLRIIPKVRRLHGDLKKLVANIEQALKDKEGFSNLYLKVWIEARERR